MRQRGGTAERVAAAWSAGFSAHASNIDTDGKTVYSWNRHVIGTTTAEGRKVRICCHYSQSTATHSGALDEWADDVQECEGTGYGNHGRPDLHPEPRRHWRRPVLFDRCLEDAQPNSLRAASKPTAVLKAHPDASCTFVCLFCGFWHPNFSWTHESRESAGEHSNDQHQDGIATHRLNPGCPDNDVLYQRKGFAGRAELWELTSNSAVTYSWIDNAARYTDYMNWQTLDQTKDGLILAFPEILVPQPTERLWWVRPYAGQTWHRCLDSNPVKHEPNRSVPAALCGAGGSPYMNNGGPSKTTFWGAYRVDPPLKGRLCAPCAEAAAVHYLGTYESAQEQAHA